MASQSIRVRMYRVGFGDCFLLTFPGPAHMLVDCGSLAGTGGERLDLVVRDIAERTGRHLDVVVASHRHGDHIGGFGRQAERWRHFEVGEVWLPWTEDPVETGAGSLRRRLDAIGRELGRRGRGFPATLARNSVTDEAAFDILLGGFKGSPRRRFLAADPIELRTDALPGVQVRVIGPRRGQHWADRMEIDCALAELTSQADLRGGAPFADRWHLGRRAGKALFAPELGERELDIDPPGSVAEQLCYWLDKAINNTSLILLLRLGRIRLLLPGDAVGDAWLGLLGAADLLAEMGQVDVYKVSHHGSRNGTPLKLCDRLGSACALLSTGVTGVDGLPDAGLLRALGRAGRRPVRRSDRAPGKRVGDDALAVELEFGPC